MGSHLPPLSHGEDGRVLQDQQGVGALARDAGRCERLLRGGEGGGGGNSLVQYSRRDSNI